MSKVSPVSEYQNNIFANEKYNVQSVYFKVVKKEQYKNYKYLFDLHVTCHPL